MILFAADNHYGTHCGKELFQCIKPFYNIRFYEDDWTCFNEDNLSGRYSLIMLNMISGSCDIPMPGSGAEPEILEYLQSGGNMFLLHGASAAFWQWKWWREIVGFRWVRPDDPDGFPPSSHPYKSCTIQLAKSRHPLCRCLQEVFIPENELYIELEQTCPTVTLMETTTDEGTFPMCYVTITEWGGIIVGYIPGHIPEVVRLPGNIANCRAIIDYLLDK